jgi:hypothetical protein
MYDMQLYISSQYKQSSISVHVVKEGARQAKLKKCTSWKKEVCVVNSLPLTFFSATAIVKHDVWFILYHIGK